MAIHLFLAVFAAVLHVFQNQRFLGFLRDPFAEVMEDENGSLLQVFAAAAWLSFNIVVSLGLIVGVGYLLVGVPHLPHGVAVRSGGLGVWELRTRTEG